ncbi:acetyl-CoA sensor PanZ family protein [Pseudomonas quasicaspiana]|uniref:acetyl-CoA sensor PanZ family protein n=1 Tax=Pseudomonas quasicaspiana TaxID=2829821 RepID=UPI001E3CE318|nr:acetyl-CoA sensor PanZ family protein [Pseudomonas quasicaspiana]MCD5978586.1 acetyl-CoA sensor PanZ family protein [Pseudomonas quasicaspiana]
MPIVVEFLQSATYQDQADLQKIYRDAPSWLFTPFADAVQLIESCLEENALVVARFNDRLVAAARLKRHEVTWELSHLCVRSPTRRRGFAEQLISEVQKSARQSGCELRLLATAEPPEVQALATKLQMSLVLY